MPRLAVNLLVLNGASVLRRCFATHGSQTLKGVVDELVVVDTGSTDGTREILGEIASDLGVARFYYERLHPFGADFFTDEAATWGRPMPGPFTGRRICADWAKARNLALDETTADYVLKLDADDEVISPPENLLRTLDYLDVKTDVDLVSAPYEIYDGHGSLEWLSMYARLWRRGDTIMSYTSPMRDILRGRLRWTQPLHEYLAPVLPQHTLFAAQGLRVRDHRDSQGDGVRVAHRNLKVLLHAWESATRENGDRKTISAPEDLLKNHVFMFTLAHEAAEVFPAFCRETLMGLMGRLAPFEAGMLSDCHYHIGRSHEAERSFPQALEAYLAADEVAPHTQALLCALRASGRLPDGEGNARSGELRERILTRTGMGHDDPLPFNCDLTMLRALRVQLGMYGTMIFHPPGFATSSQG